jgi:predicted dehydrogenase
VRRTQVGLVGAGSVAARHAGVLAQFPDATVTAVADPVVAAAGRLAADCDARAYTDAAAMLDNERLDAVYICVPPFAHGAPEDAVLARELPFFVEKPIGIDVAVGERIAAQVEATGIATGTGYHWRCLDITEQARDLLRENPARLAIGTWLDRVPPVPWWVRQDRSGGQMVEQVTHVLDLARVLLGEVVSVSATAARSGHCGDGADIDDVTVATVTFASGALGTFAATCLLERRHDTALRTVSPGLGLTLSEERLVVEGSGEYVVHLPREEAKVQVDREFIDAVAGRRERTRAPYPEALRSHRVACAIAESARTGAPVLVPQPVPAADGR